MHQWTYFKIKCIINWCRVLALCNNDVLKSRWWSIWTTCTDQKHVQQEVCVYNSMLLSSIKHPMCSYTSLCYWGFRVHNNSLYLNDYKSNSRIAWAPSYFIVRITIFLLHRLLYNSGMLTFSTLITQNEAKMTKVASIAMRID